MRIRFVVGAAVAHLFAAYAALGETSATDDRISLSADGSTLTGINGAGTDGGGGGAAAWLHSFDADSLGTLGIEHQVIGPADWTFGSVSGSVGRDLDGARFNAYAEAHEGAGDDGTKAFHYKIEAAGVVGTFYHQLSATLEDRRIDVETTHGNLPKVGLSYLWGPKLQTSVAYQYSVSGNLGTRLVTTRIDRYGAVVNFLGGIAYGQASATVLDLGIEIPGRQLKEGYVGVVKPFSHSHSELSLVADYLDLSGSKRDTLTLSYIFHVGAHGTAR
jgi:hypothetical protein